MFLNYNYCVFSPKSPPNSPNNELEDDLRGVFINYSNKVSLVRNKLHLKIHLPIL